MPLDLTVHDWPLPYESRLEHRALASVDLVVIHCTELPDMAMAREFGERIRYEKSQTGNSGHYYIDFDGTVHRFVAQTDPGAIPTNGSEMAAASATTAGRLAARATLRCPLWMGSKEPPNNAMWRG